MTGETGKRSYVVGQTEIAARPREAALYLVATPIGNLADITLRALETLAAADIVACEDTRVSRVLLDRYGIRRRTTAYHEHNAGEAGPKLIAALESGQSVALISDAGTPLISDPGYRLVGEAIARGIPVVPVPGASASLAIRLPMPNRAPKTITTTSRTAGARGTRSRRSIRTAGTRTKLRRIASVTGTRISRPR